MNLSSALLSSLSVTLLRLAEVSPRFRDWVLRPLVMRFVDDAAAAWAHAGPTAWDRWYLPAARAFGRARASYLRERLRIDPSDARSLGSVHDYEDPLLGITGHWEVSSRELAQRVETECPIGDRLRATGCSDFCRVIVHAFEEETLIAINPDYQLEPLTELLSAGDACCRFVHRVGSGASER